MNAATWALAIAMGAAVGALFRHAVYLGVERWGGKTALPLATLYVNLTGSFAIGIVVSLGSTGILDRFSVEFLAAGGCGAFTTFSSFSADWLRLNRTKRRILGLSYVGMTSIGGIALAAAGLALGRMIG